MPCKPDSAVEAACVRHSVMAGVGEGKVYSDIESLTAIMKTVGPLIFNGALVVGRRTNMPWLGGAVAAASHIMAQVSTNDEICIKNAKFSIKNEDGAGVRACCEGR